ncbi:MULTISPECIES: hypothetical protein [unclassified Sphingomonas]|uniref:hypothetical protein n=1 Tax=unclassified Sphingomonas TaxID=196159 RepID=UPI002151A971|nr:MULTISPECIES: hypothetical protein [unclassified Sphingomonas]MCR5870294.1 hypothetical protein [Sphingomonas sp. J344]UUY01527.1 hypothetical protein LRS08_10275 [Sphingomonas sp. J315]
MTLAMFCAVSVVKASWSAATVIWVMRGYLGRGPPFVTPDLFRGPPGGGRIGMTASGALAAGWTPARGPG